LALDPVGSFDNLDDKFKQNYIKNLTSSQKRYFANVLVELCKRDNNNLFCLSTCNFNNVKLFSFDNEISMNCTEALALDPVGSFDNLDDKFKENYIRNLTSLQRRCWNNAILYPNILICTLILYLFVFLIFWVSIALIVLPFVIMPIYVCWIKKSIQNTTPLDAKSDIPPKYEDVVEPPPPYTELYV
jgi:hypothetical protein